MEKSLEYGKKQLIKLHKAQEKATPKKTGIKTTWEDLRVLNENRAEKEALQEEIVQWIRSF